MTRVKPITLSLALLLCTALLGGCNMPTGGLVNMANPASVYCEDQGYTLEIRSDADGNEYGVCLFPDGSECEEWAYYRGECAPTGAGGGEGPSAAPANAVSVSYEGVSFSYDASLASGVVGEIVPAVTEDVAWAAAPEHIMLSFNGYILPNTFHEPRILVYPIADYVAANPNVSASIAEIQQILNERPSISPTGGFESPGIPFLPVWNAAQMIRAGGVYLDFQNGAGVRFLTQYGQAIYPINNADLFYAFQGITNDGAFYVAAILPVSNPILPANEDIPGDPTAFGATFETYAADIAQQLETQSASSFTPDLALLDAMIQTLTVTAAP